MNKELTYKEIVNALSFKCADLFLQLIIYYRFVFVPLNKSARHNNFDITQHAPIFFFIIGLYQILLYIVHTWNRKKYSDFLFGREVYSLMVKGYFICAIIIALPLLPFKVFSFSFPVLHLIALYYFIISTVETVRLFQRYSTRNK